MNDKYLDSNGLLYLWNKIKNIVGTKVDKVEGKGLSTQDFTTEDKTKLDGLEPYELPIATNDVLGGVKIGDGLTIDQGVLSSDGLTKEEADTRYLKLSGGKMSGYIEA